MIGPGQRAIQSQVLFDHRRSESSRGDRRGQAERVVAVADRHPKALAKGGHGAQVGIGRCRGIGAGAVQQEYGVSEEKIRIIHNFSQARQLSQNAMLFV